MKTNDVVTVLTTAGEFVGKYESSSDQGVVLKDPKMIVFHDEQMGFARGVCNTGVENPKSVHFREGGLCFVTKTNEAIASAYWETLKQTQESETPSKIAMPESKIIV